MSDRPWIDWPGGEQPVSDKTLIEIRLRDGTTGQGRARRWWWRRERNFSKNSYDLVAYRMVRDDDE